MWFSPCCKLAQASPSVASQTPPANSSDYRVSNVVNFKGNLKWVTSRRGACSVDLVESEASSVAAAHLNLTKLRPTALDHALTRQHL